MIELKDIGRSYEAGGKQEYILKDLSLTVERGDFIAIMGASGSGKSTLLHILGGLDRPCEGTYDFQGQSMEDLSERKRARIRNKQIGFVFQSFHLIPNLSVYQNVLLPLTYHKGFISHKKQKVMKALETVGLTDHVHKRPDQLSGGQKQRVAVARAIVNEPSFILADEPTGSLDEKNSEVVMEIFEKLHQQGATIVVITHDYDVAKRANQILYLRHGKVKEYHHGTI